MQLIVERHPTTPEASAVEVVERKGLGHPDTLCDAIAEAVCVDLCREYLRHFGVILHHNVDKVLLCGGVSRAKLGGGEILAPIEVYLAGRATREWRGAPIPVDQIAIDACRRCLAARLPELDPIRHLRIIARLRPGSADLAGLFASARKATPANDTSCGVGFAPLTDLERMVLAVERALNDEATKRAHPELGADVKVMGVRNGRRVSLTVACALIGRHVPDHPAYVRAKEAARAIVLGAAARTSAALETDATINAADDLDRGVIYLTVTGTSAEAGDDGEVGRGNRVNGLITPYRPMTMEAAAGKNPVSHVGKTYNVVAQRIAAEAAQELTRGGAASCVLVSRIGRPIGEPQLAHLELAGELSAGMKATSARAEQLVRAHLDRLPAIRDELVAGTVALY